MASTRPVSLAEHLFERTPLVLVDHVTIADGTTSDYFSGFDGTGPLVFKCEAREFAGASLTITVEHSPDGVTWATLDAFAEITAAGDSYLLAADAADDQLRCSYDTDAPATLKVSVLASAGAAT